VQCSKYRICRADLEDARPQAPSPTGHEMLSRSKNYCTADPPITPRRRPDVTPGQTTRGQMPAKEGAPGPINHDGGLGSRVCPAPLRSAARNDKSNGCRPDQTIRRRIPAKKREPGRMATDRGVWVTGLPSLCSGARVDIGEESRQLHRSLTSVPDRAGGSRCRPPRNARCRCRRTEHPRSPCRSGCQ
jgi:hypothetical protein